MRQPKPVPKPWRDRLLCFLAFLAPLILIVPLSLGLFGNAIFPPFVLDRPQSDLPATMLADLTSLLISMSIGLAVASVVLYRQPLRDGGEHAGNIVLCLGMAAALVSIYSGLRFRYDLAQQLSFAPFDFSKLRMRIYLQGGALLLQVCLLSLRAMLHHLSRHARATGAKS
jgi:hypothetical protein